MSESIDLSFHPGRVTWALHEPSVADAVGATLLRLPGHVSATWLGDDVDDLATLIVDAQVYLENCGFALIGACLPRTLTLRGFQVAEDLRLLLSDEQFLAIDAARGEDAVRLRVDLTGTLMSPDRCYPSYSGQASLRIAPASWAAILDNANIIVATTIRVPTPPDGGPSDDVASLARAGARLREARAQLASHSWEGAVATARKVLEVVIRLDPVPAQAESWQSLKAPQRDQRQRWDALLGAAQSLASGAHHDDEITASFRWNRHDAETIVAVAAGLLARAAARGSGSSGG